MDLFWQYTVLHLPPEQIYPHRYYLNPAFDILKLVYFFSTVKNDVEVAEKFPVPEVQRTMVVYPDELEVARMYPDVNEAKRVEIRVYRSVQNSGKD